MYLVGKTQNAYPSQWDFMEREATFWTVEYSAIFQL